MACIALVATGLTFLMRRNRTVVTQPIFEDGVMTGARTVLATPSMPELAEETNAANIAAVVVGGNIATIIAQVREANEAFQQTLVTEREMFLQTLTNQRVTAA